MDGESHGMGRNAHLDALRDEWLTEQGYVTLRISARDVFRNLEGVVSAIVEGCEAQPLRRRCAPPPPRPGEDQ
ncbi:MAG TPA: DUF559 domain-containing protein [Sphingomicrobium sp.]|nr:DUF559 domain-containing protein [Sphingomicrobium sp.]